MVKNYEGEVFEELKGIYIIDFYANWCAPCRMLGEVLDSLENVNIIKINVDEHEDLARKYKVMSIPHMLWRKDGVVEKELLGLVLKDELEEEIENLK